MFCEFCGSGPTCGCCGRGLFEVTNPRNGQTVAVLDDETQAATMASAGGFEYRPAWYYPAAVA